MAYFALLYKSADRFIERRGPFREEHLGLAQEAHARGELLLAGAFAEPPDGALLVFQGADPSAAERFAQADPYVKNGLIEHWQVRPWTVVVGGSSS